HNGVLFLDEALQWGRRVHSAKRGSHRCPYGRRARFNGVAEFTRRRARFFPGYARQFEPLQWGRRVHSAKRERGERREERGEGSFNGVAEFTRRRENCTSTDTLW